jgi:hypothetical protein
VEVLFSCDAIDTDRRAFTPRREARECTVVLPRHDMFIPGDTVDAFSLIMSLAYNDNLSLAYACSRYTCMSQLHMQVSGPDAPSRDIALVRSQRHGPGVDDIQNLEIVPTLQVALPFQTHQTHALQLAIAEKVITFPGWAQGPRGIM